ncbi:SUKH-3 domain-containing protein [Hymenobacter sp. UYP22]|uniref:SUKH-3 domain-containing protein n=1 Tax=Hymenobacter sp. UYP22 TaxID=3156348 RepID=UPI00339A3E20
MQEILNSALGCRFSPLTGACLRKAGWYTGRKVLTLKYRVYLSIYEKYNWFPEVAAFLEEFGGLAIKFKREEGGSDELNFHACDASAGVDVSWVQKDYAQRIGHSQFCVIGTAFSDHLLLFMDGEGRVYGGFDDYLCYIAEDGTKAIERICTNQPVQEIA